MGAEVAFVGGIAQTLMAMPDVGHTTGGCGVGGEILRRVRIMRNLDENETAGHIRRSNQLAEGRTCEMCFAHFIASAWMMPSVIEALLIAVAVVIGI